MDRVRLAEMLSEAGGGVFVACRDALLAGARFWVDEQACPAAPVAVIYARRERITARRGLPTSGFAAAVVALRAQGDQLIRIGAVDVDEPPYHFQLFLDDGLSAVVACLGVDQRLGFRLRPGDRVLLACDVVGVVSSGFPGWLRVRFTDAAGREWRLVDKAPVFATCAGLDMVTVRGTVVELLARESAGAPPLVRVSTALDGVSAEHGTDVFTVSDGVLRRPAGPGADRAGGDVD